MDTATKNLSAACRLALVQLYADTSEFDDLPEPEYSAEFRRFIKKLNSHVRNNKYHRLTKTAKIILIAAILALMAALGAFAAKELRVYLIDHGIWSSVEADKQIGVLTDEITLGYIPEGMQITEEEHSNYSQSKTFQDKENHYFTIQKQSGYDRIGIDTENKASREIIKNGLNYTIIYGSDNPLTVVWIDPQTRYFYILSGIINEDELLKIAFQCR
ncbi:MAG: DUF4367 domain-containing protein [Clostridia bacterium]|nr:DUF4367 domain-containing protein [Clostridia bacterium]